MVTKLDVFEVAYKNNPIKPIEVVKKLNKDEKEYDNIHKILRSLVKDNLLIKTSAGFDIKKSEKIRLLHEIIQYCTNNSINYNLLINKNLTEFIYNALGKKEIKQKEIKQKDIKINPRTFRKYIERLDKYGLLLIISKKPIKARIFYNTLINNLFVYFDFKHKPLAEFPANYLEEIEKELALYKRLRKKNEAGYRRIIDEFEIAFVQHSLALEGNPITLPDTIKIIKEEIIPKDLRAKDVDEVKNYQNALLRMLKDILEKRALSIEVILEYHRTAMMHRSDIAGKIRKIPVKIKGNPNFKIVNVSEIKPRLEQLLKKYSEFLKKKKSSVKEIIDFASYFHNEFQHIHPFVDGNSRITRLITFHLLNSKDIPILDIPFGLLDEYINDTKGAKARNDKYLFQSLQKIMLFNLKKINKRLSE